MKKKGVGHKRKFVHNLSKKAICLTEISQKQKELTGATILDAFPI